jgi:hypothetical protein
MVLHLRNQFFRLNLHSTFPWAFRFKYVPEVSSLCVLKFHNARDLSLCFESHQDEFHSRKLFVYLQHTDAVFCHRFVKG